MQIQEEQEEREREAEFKAVLFRIDRADECSYTSLAHVLCDFVQDVNYGTI